MVASSRRGGYYPNFFLDPLFYFLHDLQLFFGLDPLCLLIQDLHLFNFVVGKLQLVLKIVVLVLQDLRVLDQSLGLHFVLLLVDLVIEPVLLQCQRVDVAGQLV